MLWKLRNKLFDNLRFRIFIKSNLDFRWQLLVVTAFLCVKVKGHHCRPLKYPNRKVFVFDELDYVLCVDD